MLKISFITITILIALSISLGSILVSESSSDSEGLCIDDPTGSFITDVLSKGEDTFVVDDILYSVNGDGSVSVKGHEDIRTSNIVIPSIVISPDGVGRTVTSIGKNAFKKVSDITSILIPDTVTKIGEGAFKECKGLKTISIPIDVKCDKEAFDKVKVESLTLTKGQTGVVKKEFWKSWKDGIVTLVVDKGVYKFDTSFKNAKRLKTVSLVEVKSIGKDQFRKCKELESFSAPGTLTIDDNAFMDCVGLRAVALGSVESIGKGIFVNCHMMSVLSSGTLFLFQMQIYMILDGSSVSLIQCHLSTESFMVPSNVLSPSGKSYPVTSIAMEAFKENKKIISLAIPDSVVKVGEHAFYNCKSLKTLSIPIGVDCCYSTKKFAFEGVVIADLTLTKGLDGTIHDRFWETWKDKIVSLVVDEGIPTFDTSFKNAKRLKTVSLMEVESIGEDQFRKCKELESFNAPGTHTIGDNAFMDCTELRSVNLDSVRSITRGIFVNCHKMSVLSSNLLFLYQMRVYMILDGHSVSLIQYLGEDTKSFVVSANVLSPSGKLCAVTTIGKEAFRDNDDITQVFIPESVIKVDEHAFHDCKSLKTITIPISIDCSYDTEKFAFEGVKPKTLTLTMGKYDPRTYMDNEFWKPFRSSLKNLTVGPGITEFETSFKGKKLESLTMYSVERIHEKQFDSCVVLLVVSIPSTVTLEKLAFGHCDELLVVEIRKVKEVGEKAFLKCDQLVSVMSESVEVIGKEAFRKCFSLRSFNLSNVKKIGSKAFYDTNVKKSSLPKDAIVSVGEKSFGNSLGTELFRGFLSCLSVAGCVITYAICFASASAAPTAASATVAIGYASATASFASTAAASVVSAGAGSVVSGVAVGGAAASTGFLASLSAALPYIIIILLVGIILGCLISEIVES